MVALSQTANRGKEFDVVGAVAAVPAGCAIDAARRTGLLVVTEGVQSGIEAFGDLTRGEAVLHGRKLGAWSALQVKPSSGEQRKTLEPVDGVGFGGFGR